MQREDITRSDLALTFGGREVYSNCVVGLGEEDVTCTLHNAQCTIVMHEHNPCASDLDKLD